ncbi:acyl carrier protein [Sphingorhabdus arenilitoris]|uniref:Acyl carrier protein n=1 Tax=Sphingorhabdus arenilitoris TaxID=1490041 RepID=A0ABV8RKF5_9SPHN
MTKAVTEQGDPIGITGADEAGVGDQSTDQILRSILSDLLGLSAEQVGEMTAETELFGALPELDSMAVAGLLTEMEDRLGILIADEDVDAELFETFGSLTQFAEAKRAA